ncbi:MAG: 16S rRNA (cytidine(1402)-2'-O)-methyltransferase [Ignavibacteria bacterium]|nr:16S rRNA (cytidine(1402)-2'-O)-methyltransferase [Ignavibacteria bacterium]
MSKEQSTYEPGLYLIPTPIGNLEDMTIRALRLLSTAEIIACEDTRVTGQLLKQYSITPQRLYSCREHNEKEASIFLCSEVKKGSRVCYVSDAGTPGISDPGSLLIQTAIEENIPYHVLPGATALIPALLQSGYSCDEWTFLGFPPHKKGRSMFIDKLANINHTIIVYESPHRIVNLMEELHNNTQLQVRPMYLIREITKRFEESYRGLPQEILAALQDSPAKGEFVLIISGSN